MVGPYYLSVLQFKMESQLSKESILQLVQQVLKELGETSTLSVETTEIQGITIHVVHFDSIRSTMEVSEHFPREHITPTTYFVFTSKSQSQGQGQRTNTWLSPPGNIYMTILGSFQHKLIPVLSVLAGLATCKLIQNNLQLSPRLKWVNDVFVNNLKVSGVLIRTQFQQFNNPHFIGQIGIGINVKQNPYQFSTSLQKQLGKQLSVDDLRGKYLTEFIGTIKGYQDNKQEGWMKEEVKKYLLYLGEHVWIYDAELKKVLHEGVFEDINQEVNAVISTSEGKVVVGNGRMRGEKIQG